MKLADKLIVVGIRDGKPEAFESLYRKYYVQLCVFSERMLKDDIAAEEIVQSLIMKLWEKRGELAVPEELKQYLFKSVYNNCLTYLRSQKLKGQNQSLTDIEIEEKSSFLNTLESVELEVGIALAKTSLPEQTRIIFELNRDEELSYPQIAEQLSISIKTVEYHISKALKHFRVELQEFMPIILLIGLGYCSDFASILIMHLL